MNIRIELAKFETGPTFKKTITQIKDNHLKSITSATMNLSAINLFGNNFKQISMNIRFEVENFEPEPTFENTINEIKANHLEIITSIDINVSAVTFITPYSYSGYLKSYPMPWILLLLPVKPPPFTKHLSSMQPKGNTQLQIRKWFFPLISALYIFFFLSDLCQYL